MHARSTLAVVLSTLALSLTAPAARTQMPWSDVQTVGKGTPGTLGVPQVRVAGIAVPGDPIPGLRLVNGRPGALAQLVVGTSTEPLALPAYRATLLPVPSLRLSTQLDDLGGSPSFTQQPSATPTDLLGLTLTVQGIVLDPRGPGGLAFSPGVEITFGNGSAAAALYGDARAFVPGAPVAVAAGDLDEDGHSDAVVARRDGLLGVLLQAPGGELHPASELASGGLEVADVTLADLDGDGHLDVVGACRTSEAGNGRLGIRLGHGDGAFGSLAIKVTGVDCQAVSIADLDGDGVLDLVATRQGGLVSFVGTGAGGFGPIRTTLQPTLDPLPWLEIADATADGVPDALVQPADSREFYTFAGVGDGSFDAPTMLLVGGSDARSMTAADVDADGRVDLVIGYETNAPDPFQYDGTDTYQGWVAVLPGLVGGGFGTPIPTALPVVPPQFGSLDVAVTAVATCFWDEDAFPDLLLTLESDGFDVDTHDVRVLLGAGDGTFVAAGAPRALAVDRLTPVDLDGDGRLDLLAPHERGHVLHVLRGAGADGLAPWSVLPTGSDAHRTPVLADLDSDGHLDLTLLRFDASDPGIDVLAGDGNGGFVAQASLPLPEAVSPVEVVDVDGDGLLDVLHVSYDEGVSVFRQQGAFDFAPAQVTSLPPAPAFSYVQTLVGHIDGDEHPDLLPVGRVIGGGWLLFARGEGDGTFTPGVLDESDFMPWELALSDVDGDGVLDVVGPAFDTSPRLLWRKGQGDGSFGPPLESALAQGAASVRAADLDGQHGDDLVLTLPYLSLSGIDQHVLQVVRSLGGGAFAEAQLLSAPWRTRFTSIADVNADGANDIIASSWEAGTLAVYLGFGDGTFTSAQPFLSTGVYEVSLGDIDENGALDVLAAPADAADGLLRLMGRVFP